MTDTQARRLLLARAAEEAGAFGRSVLSAARVQADSTGENPEAQLARRADFLLQRLDPQLARLCEAQLPGLPLWVGSIALAFLIGALSNGLSPSERIHAFLNPLALLILWNLGVYLASVGLAWGRRRAPSLSLRREPDPSARPSSVSRQLLSAPARLAGRILLWLAVRIRRLPPVLRQATGESPTADDSEEPTPSSLSGSGIATRYLKLYWSYCHEPLIQRFSALLSLAAVGFATGVVAGMYLQAIAYDYTVAWKSALIDSDLIRLAILRALYFPATIALGVQFPDLDDVRSLASEAGGDATIWLHVFAISAAAYVVIPRLALFAWSLARASRSGSNIRLDLDEPFWRDALHPPFVADEAGLTRMLLRELGLGATATTVLRSLQVEMLERDLRAVRTSGRRRSRNDERKAWLLRWRKSLDEEFDVFPPAQRPVLSEPGAIEFVDALEHVRSSRESPAADVVLLELLLFEPYGPLELDRHRRFPKLRREPKIDREIRANVVREAAKRLGRSQAEVDELAEAYRKARQALQGGASPLLKIGVVTASGVALAATAGLAAPLVGGAIGSWMGLSGIVAVKAGLALLGKGALAAGGFGVTGGTAALVAAGAALGSGGAASLVSRLTAAEVLGFAAETEAILRISVVAGRLDWRRFDAFCSWLASTTAHLREELPRLKESPSIRDAQVREHEKILDIYEVLSRRLEDWGRAQRGRSEV